MADALHGFLCLPPSFSHVQTTYATIQSFLGEEPNGHE